MGKISKKQWHLRYKYTTFKMFNFNCNFCSKKISMSEGAVHHLSYFHPKGIYQVRPEEIKEKLCIACHRCHTLEHEGKSIDGITRILSRHERKYQQCNDCGEVFDLIEYALDDSKRCEVCARVHFDTMREYDPE